MLRRALLSAALILGVAQMLQGASFPSVQVSTLAGTELALPQAIGDQNAFLVIGFTQASEKQTTVWRKQVESRYSTDPHLVVYPVVVIENIPRIFRGLLIAGIRAGVPREAWGHFLVVSESEAKWRDAIGWKGGDLAYLVLLDKKGRIAWKDSGSYTESAAGALEDAIRRLEQLQVSK